VAVAPRSICGSFQLVLPMKQLRAYECVNYCWHLMFPQSIHTYKFDAAEIEEVEVLMGLFILMRSIMRVPDTLSYPLHALIYPRPIYGILVAITVMN